MVTDMQMSLPSVEQIWTWLGSVSDPEIPVLSVIDLGIVRDVKWIKDNEETDFTTKQTSPRVNQTSANDGRLRRPGTQRTESSDSSLLVTITPTYSGCPAMAVIKAEILRALEEHGLSRVRIETQLSPAWTTDWMTERGKHRLLEYGIAPPGLHAPDPSTQVPCPRCGSSDTRVVSQFGSTPCKAFYICNSCLEPFDYFKCH
jgi:ring-1,2-phenylacetyl-CoA epoxidase subunit PaaD